MSKYMIIDGIRAEFEENAGTLPERADYALAVDNSIANEVAAA